VSAEGRVHRCDHDCPPAGVAGAVATGEIYHGPTGAEIEGAEWQMPPDFGPVLGDSCVRCDGVGCSHCNYGGI
jgi:hypothetical protein